MVYGLGVAPVLSALSGSPPTYCGAPLVLWQRHNRAEGIGGTVLLIRFAPRHLMMGPPYRQRASGGMRRI
ncbi:MAG: hypothetical protein RLZZ387_4597 [Chloroflexota bacterium]